MQQLQRIYVANLESNDVSVIDTVANTVIATVPVGRQPGGMAVSPDGARLYVANSVSGSVSVIETSSNAVVATITVGAGPSFMTLTPDGTRIYVANSALDNNSVSVIDAATNTVLVTVPVGETPLAISRDGTRVYVANNRGSSVSVIDTASNTVVATVGVGAVPSFLVGTPDGSQVYVANRGDDVVSSSNMSAIDTASNNPAAAGIQNGMFQGDRVACSRARTDGRREGGTGGLARLRSAASMDRNKSCCTA